MEKHHDANFAQKYVGKYWVRSQFLLQHQEICLSLNWVYSLKLKDFDKPKAILTL